MNYKLFIVKKLFKERKQLKFVTSITNLTIFGIAIGVSALLIVLAVFNGFESEVKKIISTNEPHLRIILNDESKFEDLNNYLKRNRLVNNYSNYVKGKCIYEKNVFEINAYEKDYLKNFNINLDSNNTIIFNENTFYNLNLIIGEKINLNTIKNYYNSFINPFYEPNFTSFNIIGSFTTKNKENHLNSSYINYSDGLKLFSKNNADGIDVLLFDINNVENIISDLKNQNFNVTRIDSWFDLHKTFFNMMKIEKYLGMIIILFITLVAIISLFASMKLLINQKITQIGIYETLGLTKKEIIKIFNFYGFLVSLIGIITGLIISIAIIYLQDNYQLYKLDQSVYIIPAIPVKIILQDFIIVISVTIILSYIAVKLSTNEIKKYIPTRILRWE